MILRVVILLMLAAINAPALGQYADDWPERPRQFTDDGRMIVDLELVFAVDVSSSIDEAEALQQRQGHVAALADPDVISAIQAGGEGRVAVLYLEWADADFQRIVAPWTVIETEEDARAFAGLLAAAPFVSGRRTAIGAAISSSVDLIENNEFEGTRRVIDISGDGPQNAGPSLSEARASADADRITVNGIPMQGGRQHPFRPPVNIDVARYFENHVITGPGAFVMASESHEEFVEALRRKLIIEIAGLFPAAISSDG
ncbi:DUF1194 domain-containing protein [Hyphobacterium marinum]|uniref:DUF1194 domain-containing protein n=1 Tax=Hyphobacterium marinum TaxID=3116574 RepID=A0ABU7LYA3_9PROT|nr:DUF1194 domain-containing protein [Hyphobacterium sp. Y6023]MEE2566514.1 DUF1194 domain-containing protein [Hyphobacterium sp. Y6023]